ncbi:DUF3168 domain-containing protein [Parasulfitobacter algicola]|uniref:DUF3168 domain-containing protein n=1 Tax=Parasulfitobacter algicola TaxID=2614809 RepID=A0ABX2ITM7_9RHOB|nr:DUF3168 domain-containing protein [Sulfitobacter algicola]NSX56254.1 DUF3168 domain-containing protein [Sulfitobacter algicola]
MSYGVSAALQAAVYQEISTNSGVQARVGTAVYDAIPSGTLPDTYITLGPEDVRDRSDMTGQGASHVFTVSVMTNAAGFQTAKELAALLSDILIDADLTLSRGSLIALNFEKALARRVGTGAERRIDLKFRALVEDN